MVRIATRNSPLALWQANDTARRLQEAHPGLKVELVPIRSGGDEDRSTALKDFGGTGVFTTAVQDAVLGDQADLAVHSLKDLPTESTDGLVLAAVPRRAARLDALLLPDGAPATDLSILHTGARIGTGSPRRQAQLLHVRPDLQMSENRGNVETRIAKLDAGEFDGIVLAEAGLRRLDLSDRISLLLEPPLMLPAVGQGALGIECRADDQATRERLAPLCDEASQQAVLAERSLLRTLRAGCHAPVGAWTGRAAEELLLTGVLLSADGRQRLEATASGSPADAEEIGRDVASQLLNAGGDALL